MTAPDDVLDAVIVGGGPAGLNAALILGRCRRRVVVFDDGRPRNRRAHALHGFLSRDGTRPAELLRLGREELAPYGSVRIQTAHVRDARRIPAGFEVELDDGTTARARTLLLATGVVDRLPEIDGLEALYGRGVHHCPYCDDWEVRDRPLVAYGRGAEVARLAVALTTWSDDVIACTDGPDGIGEAERDELAVYGIEVLTQPIARLEGDADGLRAVRFRDGSLRARGALFFTLGVEQCSPLAERLGCRVTDESGAETGDLSRTGVPGLFVAGDASRDVALVIVAAAEGAEAAFAINKLLVRQRAEQAVARARATAVPR